MKKKLQSIGFFFLATLFLTTSLLATTANNYPTVKTLRTEIITLIKKPDLSTLATPEETVQLSFLVNEHKEVVVINADTNNDYLKEYVRTNLNYQKIKTDFVQLNKVYHIKLIFKKK